MMNLCKRICTRNLPDKDNILQVMLKIMLHKYLKKIYALKVMLKIYMYRESCKIIPQVARKKLYVKVMSIIKSYDDSLFFTEDAQKLY